MVADMYTRRTFSGAMLISAGRVALSTDLTRLSLQNASGMLRAGKVSPVELTKACLERIEALNTSLNAFVTVTGDDALAAARAAETELRSGRRRSPLHGIPIALKDLIDTKGIRTTAGSAQYEERIPRQDAEVVRRLKEAGAILLGKTNLDEFAYNFTSETSRFGPSRNPWNAECSPGGSSGGSAIAAVTGMCYAALGSDTGGSIRLPAALCGITGFKPSYGRVSTSGATPLAWSLDHIGPMCRSAQDACVVAGVMSGANFHFRGSVKGLRLGVPRRPYFEKLHPEVDGAVAAAIRDLAAITAGARDVDLPALPPFPDMPDLPLAYSVVIVAEAYAFHEEMLKRSPDRYHPGTRRSIESGAAMSAAEYIRARRELERLRAGSGRLFAEADVLITPTAPGPAFELGSRPGLVFLRNTAPWNLYGLPSISIPCGFSKGGLPVGLQITGPAGRDDVVFGVAAAYQGVTDWHTRRPK